MVSKLQDKLKIVGFIESNNYLKLHKIYKVSKMRKLFQKYWNIYMFQVLEFTGLVDV